VSLSFAKKKKEIRENDAGLLLDVSSQWRPINDDDDDDES
jgi:hypothetical protein